MGLGSIIGGIAGSVIPGIGTAAGSMIGGGIEGMMSDDGGGVPGAPSGGMMAGPQYTYSQYDKQKTVPERLQGLEDQMVGAITEAGDLGFQDYTYQFRPDLFAPEELEAIEMYKQVPGMFDPYIQGGLGAVGVIQGLAAGPGGIVDPWRSSYTEAVVDPIQRKIIEDEQQFMNQLRQQAGRQGAFGTQSGMYRTLTDFAENTAQRRADALAPIYMQAENQAMQNMFKGLGMAADPSNIQGLLGAKLSGIGALDRAGQKLYERDYGERMREFAFPYERAKFLMGTAGQYIPAMAGETGTQLSYTDPNLTSFGQGLADAGLLAGLADKTGIGNILGGIGDKIGGIFGLGGGGGGGGGGDLPFLSGQDMFGFDLFNEGGAVRNYNTGGRSTVSPTGFFSKDLLTPTRIAPSVFAFTNELFPSKDFESEGGVIDAEEERLKKLLGIKEEEEEEKSVSEEVEDIAEDIETLRGPDSLVEGEWDWFDKQEIPRDFGSDIGKGLASILNFHSDTPYEFYRGGYVPQPGLGFSAPGLKQENMIQQAELPTQGLAKTVVEKPKDQVMNNQLPQGLGQISDMMFRPPEDGMMMPPRRPPFYGGRRPPFYGGRRPGFGFGRRPGFGFGKGHPFFSGRRNPKFGNRVGGRGLLSLLQSGVIPSNLGGGYGPRQPEVFIDQRMYNEGGVLAFNQGGDDEDALYREILETGNFSETLRPRIEDLPGIQSDENEGRILQLGEGKHIGPEAKPWTDSKMLERRPGQTPLTSGLKGLGKLLSLPGAAGEKVWEGLGAAYDYVTTPAFTVEEMEQIIASPELFSQLDEREQEAFKAQWSDYSKDKARQEEFYAKPEEEAVPAPVAETEADYSLGEKMLGAGTLQASPAATKAAEGLEKVVPEKKRRTIEAAPLDLKAMATNAKEREKWSASDWFTFSHELSQGGSGAGARAMLAVENARAKKQQTMFNNMKTLAEIQKDERQLQIDAFKAQTEADKQMLAEQYKEREVRAREIEASQKVLDGRLSYEDTVKEAVKLTNGSRDVLGNFVPGNGRTLEQNFAKLINLSPGPLYDNAGVPRSKEYMLQNLRKSDPAGAIYD